MPFEGVAPLSPEMLTLSLLVGLIAFLYASVGHGGASGYLAVVALLGLPPARMAGGALILNIVVASLAFGIYARHGYFSWRLTWPFLLASVPAAFCGGWWKIPPVAYSLILGVALCFAAWRLLYPFNKASIPDFSPRYNTPPEGIFPFALAAGGLIGWISGMVGVGGGIFLSPLMVLSGWADMKRTSATAALFIVINAIAGLLSRLFQGESIPTSYWPLLIAAMAGGLAGASMGANRFSGLLLRRMLGGVLLIAAGKLLTAGLYLL